MNRAIRRDSSRNRGVSSTEYIIVAVLVGISVIITYRAFGTQLKCLVASATGAFGGSEAPACGGKGGDGDGSGGPGAPGSNGPGGGPAGPGPGVTCVGSSCTSAGSCFVAGTLVETAAGAAPIESITAGTLVLARPEEGGAPEWKPVARTFARVAPALVELRVGAGAATETIDVTPEHRLRTAHGWVDAGALVPGRDTLVDADGAALPLVAAASLPGEVAVYNLEVADFHTYFVGAQAIWAHNACGPVDNGNGSFTVPGHPGLTLAYDPAASDPEYGYNVYTITSGPLAGQQIHYDGPDKSYYNLDGDPVQNQLNSNYPGTLNNGGGTTYNFNNKPGVQVVSLQSVLSQVTLRDNPKDPSGLQTAMNSNTPLDPIVLHHEPGGGVSVTDGNTRLQAAINNGLTNIPIVYDN